MLFSSFPGFLVSNTCSCIAVIYPSVCACRFSHLLVFFMSMVSSSDRVFRRYPCVTFLFHFSSRSFLVPSLTLLLSWYASLRSMNSFPSLLIVSFSCSSTNFSKLCSSETISRCSIKPIILILYKSSVLLNPLSPSLLCAYNLSMCNHFKMFHQTYHSDLIQIFHAP